MPKGDPVVVLKKQLEDKENELKDGKCDTTYSIINELQQLV